MDNSPSHICISRTDSIGDVVLTLPLCGFLKNHFPNAKISFLCRTYTKPIVGCCTYVDEVINADEFEQKPEKDVVHAFSNLKISHFIHVFPNKYWSVIAKKALIPHRIGTSHRYFHWLSCNHKVNFTRRKSDLHEAQLNFHLVKPLGFNQIPDFDKLIEYVGFTPPLIPNNEAVGSLQKKRVILHPLSQGSAVEWTIENFMTLAKMLAEANFQVFISGTEKEGKIFKSQVPIHQNIINVSGKFTLEEFIVFINSCDALVACSTGPLHIAGVLGKIACGIFSPVKPIHPGRWKPLGKNVKIFEGEEDLDNHQELQGHRYIKNISPALIAEYLMKNQTTN